MTKIGDRVRCGMGTILSAVLLPALFTSQLAAAGTQPDYEQLKLTFLRFGGNKFDPKKVDQYLTRLYREFDSGDDGIDRQDIQVNQSIAAARRRASVMLQYLTHDLDGDLRITEEEATKTIQALLHMSARSSAASDAASLQPKIQSHLGRLMNADSNRDGVLDIGEIAAESALSLQRSFKATDHRMQLIEMLSHLDPDGDGKVTQTEAYALLSQAYGATGSEADKAPPPPTQAPKAEAPALKASPSVSAMRPGCKPEPVSDKGKMVLVSIFLGRSLSSVAMGDQKWETSVSHIHIQPGSESLTVVLVSFTRVIWTFEGATERIDKVILASDQRDNPGDHVISGVTGITQDKVSFVRGNGCLPSFTDDLSEEAHINAARARVLFGRKPDIVIARNGIHTLELPSGKELVPSKAENENYLTVMKPNGILVTIGTDGVVRVHKNSDAAPNTIPSLEERHAKHYPGGLAKLDAAAVVGDVPAQPYEVLPGRAGLLQLLREGALQPWSEKSYRIVKKMRYPGALGPGYKLFLEAGVPVPDGDPGGTCVFSEQTATFINGNSCK